MRRAEFVLRVKGDHHQTDSLLLNCAPLLLVPKLHLGTELVFEALLRSAWRMIIIPRQYNCRDKCVPKCNLGTRNGKLLPRGLTLAMLQTLRLARKFDEPGTIARRIATLPFLRPFDHGPKRAFAFVLRAAQD